MKSKIIISFVMFLCIVFFLKPANADKDIMAVTGASPAALAEKTPSGVMLKITGLVKQEYSFPGDALKALASTRIRTQEVASNGIFFGTYAYIGIPVLHILEGIAPKMPEQKGAFDRPLDFIVTFISSSGKSVNFSYGEIIFVNDSLPVTLAYDRKEIKASKDPDKYDKNFFKENVKGLRLICPRDADTDRYLDDVAEIVLKRPVTRYGKFPDVKKANCISKAITCVSGKNEYTGKFEGLENKMISNWMRVGHGQGFKGISSAEGYSLRAFLKKNFPNCSKDNFFLFAACDGYRCLFSGREIFEHSDGESMMILEKLDGKEAHGGYMLAPVKDYFVDRDVWGLSHVVLLDR